jgi:hypothetical protein
LTPDLVTKVECPSLTWEAFIVYEYLYLGRIGKGHQIICDLEIFLKVVLARVENQNTLYVYKILYKIKKML